MPSTLSDLERRAEVATKFPPFQINLQRLRDEVHLLLKEFGRHGFFNEYTDHSFDHVLSMISTADWIIPDASKSLLTDGDCLMLVLSLYFHDLGLLITADEFSKRDNNIEYNNFIQNPKIPEDKIGDFRAKMSQLSFEESNRFWYQEFVRYTHGSRIKSWIEGYELDDGGATNAVRQVINEILRPLDGTFRRDLGLVCESHTIDDISDIKIFKLSQPYGDTRNENVNLQYVSAILRTVDLLQITKNRAPSILFQIINPADPISQIEWLKQGAVRAVRKRIGTDKEGNASPSVPSDTIEIHATFRRAEGFFGLTNYLQYAEKELLKTHNVIQKSERYLTEAPLFPWKFINFDNIEADGFLTKAFGFSLDQHKILELLTGHTLYNDTSVVLRELTQNSLDAIRLQALQDESQSSERGIIKIHWNSKEKILTVSDNGTGMSQEIIEQHLLTVGSSRYQDPKFREKNPTFSSISRFGIGVLSAFMVSDHVEITTCFPDDSKARRIELRSLHGKYLIKLLDKVSDRDELKIYPHGTSVKLFLRASAEIGDVVKTARSWLIFPRCKVYVTVDESSPIEIGFTSPTQAVEHILKEINQKNMFHGRNVEIREFSENGVSIAFAVSRDDYFREWTFVKIPDVRGRSEFDSDFVGATCIEGIGVDFKSPGFREGGIIAVANAVGPESPKTNVARSALEDTPEYYKMLRTIYRLYTKHIANEIDRLSKEDGYSLSRAVNETQYIIRELGGYDFRQGSQLINPELFVTELSGAPFALVEKDGTRRAVSLDDLENGNGFWTVTSPLSTSVETFIRESPSNITADNIISVIDNASAKYPSGTTLCNHSVAFELGILGNKFEISSVRAYEGLRRLDVKWDKKGPDSNWIFGRDIARSVALSDERLYRQAIFDFRNFNFSPGEFCISRKPVNILGLDKYIGFNYLARTFITHGNPVSDYFLALISEGNTHDSMRRVFFSIFLFAAITNGISEKKRNTQFVSEPDSYVSTSEIIRKTIQDSGFFHHLFEDQAKEIIKITDSLDIKIFSPTSWMRSP